MELANGETACMLGQRHASRATHVLGLDWPELLVQVELMNPFPACLMHNSQRFRQLVCLWIFLIYLDMSSYLPESAKLRGCTRVPLLGRPQVCFVSNRLYPYLGIGTAASNVASSSSFPYLHRNLQAETQMWRLRGVGFVRSIAAANVCFVSRDHYTAI